MSELPRRFGGSDWLDLGPDEEVLWAGHPSLVASARKFAAGVALVVLGTVGALALDPYGIVGVLGVVAGLGFIALTHFRRISTGYVITSAEVYHKEGLVSRDVTQIRYERIQNTSFSQSVLERALSYGDVVITSAGTGEVEITLHNVPDPARLKRILSEQLDDVYAQNRTPAGSPARSDI